MKCTKCKSDRIVKNGKRQGQQCYKCKGCGRQFTGDMSFIEREKRAALTLCCFGLSFRKIGYLMGYSHVTILNWAHEFEKREIIDLYEDYFMELDEVSEFLVARTRDPKLGKRFVSIQEALAWNVENEVSKILEKTFESLTV